MALNLYREHTKDCLQGRRVRLHNRKAEEAPSRGWKKCDCEIYASGTLADGFKRKNTGRSTWQEAEAQAEAWEKAGAWTAPVQAPAVLPLAEPEPASPITTKIVDALEITINKCEKRGIKVPTLKKYKTFCKQLQAFCDSKGYVTMGQLKPDDGDLFYNTWKDGPRAAGRKLERFRKFTKIWLKKGWITSDLGVFDIEPPMHANEGADRVPYTDDELARMYKACDDLGEVVWTNQLGAHSWNGEDAKDFIILMVYTGFRISDAAFFDTKERLKRNDIFIRALKNDKRIYTWVPDWVRDRLLDREEKYGTRIFKTGESDKLETVTDTWRKKLAKIFELVEADAKFETKPIPHRFRYTWVRILLERGVELPHVAELSGDTEEVILKYYAKWVPERQDQLRKALQTAFADRPKLVAVGKKKPA